MRSVLMFRDLSLSSSLSLHSQELVKGRNKQSPAIPPNTESKITVWDSRAVLVDNAIACVLAENHVCVISAC
ncbi:hypothetical protein NIES4073_03620 (plasmid) [Kalymmatonema gypsitolerans NIES-4073]|nr:hypothetical protein NIES4073_03620 [Scytonema sp. NIES-4073]